MSNDYHRPTLTFPSGAYNVTQVRLYGLCATIGFAYPGYPVAIGSDGMFVGCDPSLKITKRQGDRALGILNSWDTTEKRLQLLAGSGPAFPKIPVKITFHVSVEAKGFGTPVVASVTDTYTFGGVPAKKASCGIIVGYAYEGHTYDLPKPKIMLIPTFPEPIIPPDDSGYDAKASEGYAVWLVDKLDQCVEWETNQGFVEQLVLEANLPGRRSPTMYAAKMVTGHRSGRLND